MVEKRKNADDGGTVEEYPRKRVAVACELCRFKKSKCDAGKPACGLCVQLGLPCKYGPPSNGVNNVKENTYELLQRLETNLQKLDDKVENISRHLERKLDILANSAQDQLAQPRSRRTSLSSSTSREGSHSIASLLNSVAEPESYLSPLSPSKRTPYQFSQSRGEVICPRPNLLTFCCPPLFNADSWDETEYFYDTEIAWGDELSRHLQQLQTRECDLSPRTTRYLQHAFINNFLSWLPICDTQDASQHVQEAFAASFDPSNESSCFAMLLFAVGAITAGKPVAHHLDHPGIEYFSRGTAMLGNWSLSTASLTILQCKLLHAVYLDLCFHPLQAWNSITQASRDCMHLLSSRNIHQRSPSWKSKLHRTFWACDVVLHTLEACLMMHPIGIDQFQDKIPLPLSQNEDSSFYYLLALISYRSLLRAGMETVGYNSGRIIHAPIVNTELRNQLSEWHAHLPIEMHFPIDDTPLFDLRKAFLRVQYFGLLVLIGWPSVLRVLEAERPFENTTEEMAVHTQAKECLSSAAMLLATAQDLLSTTNVGVQFALWASYASLTELILTFRCPVLRFCSEPQLVQYIQDGYDMLSGWDHVLIVNKALTRTRKLMQDSGIPIPA